MEQTFKIKNLAAIYPRLLFALSWKYLKNFPPHFAAALYGQFSCPQAHPKATI